MNIQLHNIIYSNTVKSIIIASMLALFSPSAYAADNYYHKMLFTPAISMLKAESRGRIMIYDGLANTTVDRAMDEQFDRIHNMMFVRIHHIQESGEEFIEDDGC